MLFRSNNYEEKGRLFLAQRGDVTHVTGTRTPIVLSRVGDNKELAGLLTDGWNSIHLVIRHNILIHNINGHLMSVTIDDDPQWTRPAGPLRLADLVRTPGRGKIG